MIKVLLYTDTPLYGGAEKQMLELARTINQKKFNPLVICGNYKSLDQFCDELKNSGIKTQRIRAKNKHSLKNYFELKQIIKNFKPDLIHANIWNPMAGKYAIFTAKKLKIPLVTTEHDPFEVKGLKKLFKRKLLEPIQKIITVSDANQKVMELLYPETKNKLTTIHNGINLKKIEIQLKALTSNKIATIKKEIFKAESNEKIILSAGTLHERKGFKYLIEAFKTVHQKYPKSKLIIAGEGPERKNLEDLIKNLHLVPNCLLISWRENIIELMAASDIFVLPSIKEAFGLVILEALACKLPVIATKAGGIPEIIKNENGLLVAAQNSNELSEAIIKILEDQALHEKLSSLGYKRVQDFKVEKNTQKTEKIYEEVIKQKKN